MDVKQSMREILEAESKAVLNIPVTDAYEEAVNLIVEQVKHEGGKLVTSVNDNCRCMRWLCMYDWHTSRRSSRGLFRNMCNRDCRSLRANRAHRYYYKCAHLRCMNR